jgi:hypothetical protein
MIFTARTRKEKAELRTSGLNKLDGNIKLAKPPK